MKGDNPFQVLATCIEYTNAVESGDPSKFVSYLPVHQVSINHRECVEKFSNIHVDVVKFC